MPVHHPELGDGRPAVRTGSPPVHCSPAVDLHMGFLQMVHSADSLLARTLPVGNLPVDRHMGSLRTDFHLVALGRSHPGCSRYEVRNQQTFSMEFHIIGSSRAFV